MKPRCGCGPVPVMLKSPGVDTTGPKWSKKIKGPTNLRPIEGTALSTDMPGANGSRRAVIMRLIVRSIVSCQLPVTGCRLVVIKLYNV